MSGREFFMTGQMQGNQDVFKPPDHHSLHRIYRNGKKCFMTRESRLMNKLIFEKCFMQNVFCGWGRGRHPLSLWRSFLQDLCQKFFCNLPLVRSNQLERQSPHPHEKAYCTARAIFRITQILFIDKLFYSIELFNSIIDVRSQRDRKYHNSRFQSSFCSADIPENGKTIFF